jgi:deoxyribodipyrimidine photo-lyase
MKNYSIFWFRRDLRLKDNKGLYYALKNETNVIPLFIFDDNIINGLPRNDARVNFIYSSLENINKTLSDNNKSMWIFKGNPYEIIGSLAEKYNIRAVYTNYDHEPYGINRDLEIKTLLQRQNIPLLSYLDHLLFEKDEILKSDGTPYQVFTPYARKCREALTESHFKYYTSERLLSNFTNTRPPNSFDLWQEGFKPSEIPIPVLDNKLPIIKRYNQTRDFPSQNGTTRLGIHLRFGTISLRQLGHQSFHVNSVFFNELLWREFYAMILWHFPHVINKSFKPQYDNIEWRNNKDEFELWKAGKTGYPLVDAGMRQLSKTGYMHNRVRMITASFLTKHLLIDWRWGEAWFAEKLLDYELSSNNGGWQWSSGSGCDAAPYFRIFNPTEQQKKFDASGSYIRNWVNEFDTFQYPGPVVEHKMARERCIKVYKDGLNNR